MGTTHILQSPGWLKPGLAVRGDSAEREGKQMTALNGLDPENSRRGNGGQSQDHSRGTQGNGARNVINDSQKRLE